MIAWGQRHDVPLLHISGGGGNGGQALSFYIGCILGRDWVLAKDNQATLPWPRLWCAKGHGRAQRPGHRVSPGPERRTLPTPPPPLSSGRIRGWRTAAGPRLHARSARVARPRLAYGSFTTVMRPLLAAHRRCAAAQEPTCRIRTLARQGLLGCWAAGSVGRASRGSC